MYCLLSIPLFTTTMHDETIQLVFNVSEWKTLPAISIITYYTLENCRSPQSQCVDKNTHPHTQPISINPTFIPHPKQNYVCRL